MSNVFGLASMYLIFRTTDIEESTILINDNRRKQSCPRVVMPQMQPQRIFIFTFCFHVDIYNSLIC